MDYASNYFGKKLDDLTYADIQAYFIDEKEETGFIEFKSFPSGNGVIEKSLDGIKKGICAMLNSDGGIIIWGAPVGQDVPGKKEKVFIGNLAPINQLIEKDMLINKISSAIIPLPVGVSVKILNSGTDYVYVFEVQKSQYSPHQFQNLYYARLDGQSQPAPHYLIEALFKKISYPNLQGYIKLENLTHNGTYYFLDISIFIFNISELQNEEDVSFRLVCDYGVFANAGVPDRQHTYSMNGHQLVHKDLINVLHFGQPNLHSERIIINPNELMKNSYRLGLFLTFGGKKSPLKISEYTINLSNINWDNAANTPFESINENQLFSEMRVALGQTIEEQISSIIGR